MESEVVHLESAHVPRPGQVYSWRAFIRIAEPVAPVVTADKIPARPAIDRSIELFEELECVGPHAFYVVSGHQRNDPDAKSTLATSGDFQAPIIGIGAGGELQRRLGIVIRKVLDRDRLPLVRAITPDKTNVDRPGSRQHNAALVLLTPLQSQARLCNTTR